MIIKRNLNKTVIFFIGFLSSTMVWADKPDITTSVQVKPLPTVQSTSASDKTPISLSADPRTRKIAESVQQNLQTLKQQRTKKNRAENNPRIAKAANRNSSKNIKVSSRSDGSIRQMRGGILEPAATDQVARSKKQRNEVTAKNFLRRNRRVLGIKSPDKELYLLKQHSDRLGRTHLKYGQRYQGLPVWPSDIVVHFAPQGHVDLMNGAYAPTPRKPLSLATRTSLEEAKTIGLSSIDAPRATFAEPAELIFYYTGQTHQLAWKMKIKASIDARWLVIVDAISGDVLLKYNEIMQLGTSGSGVDLLNQNQSLQLYENNGTFFMLDTTKDMYDPSSTPPDPNSTRGGIFLFDAQNQDPEAGPINVSLVNSSAATSGFLPDAVSAAFNISQVYDYYLERHNRNSIDDNKGSMSGIVRVGQNFDNAFWDGERMFFGDAVPYAAALDVVAHEVSHGVIQLTSNLIYQGQSGALNEAFADIFGEMVEARTMGNDWIIGSVLPAPLRNMRDPSSLLISGTNTPYPSKMSDFLAIQEDNGGVHINSGIINRAYYLLAEGLDNAIGLAEAEQIFYRALTTHLVRNSQFIDARLAAIASADELFGENSIQSNKTAEAFDQVEILDNIAGTPPPPSIPAVSGQDATLFVCFDDKLGANFLCRHDESLGDPPQGVFLSRFDILSSRPSVSGDGSIAAFVDSVNDICLINTDGSTDELCVGLPGTVSAAAISPNLNFFGYVFLGSDNQPDNSITIIELSTDTEESTSQTFELVAPAIDASTINNIAFADVMNFTADGRFIIYDALTEFNLLDGTKVNNWNIYALEMQTGQTFILTSATPGFNISNPSLGQTNDNFMTFAVSESDASSTAIVTSNLNSGEVKAIKEVTGAFSVPVYNGDDNAVIFDQVDQTAPTGFSLLRQGLSDDHITAAGEADLWLFDAVYGVTYRRGEFIGSVEETGFYDLETEILRIHAVDVTDVSGQITTYQADLILTSSDPIQLRLSTASVINAQLSGGNAVYDTSNGKVSIPRVSITDKNSNTQTFRVEMNSISDAFDFEVTSLELIQ